VKELSLDVYEGGGYPEEKHLFPRAWVELSCQSPDWDWALRGGEERSWQVRWLPLPPQDVWSNPTIRCREVLGTANGLPTKWGVRGEV